MQHALFDESVIFFRNFAALFMHRTSLSYCPVLKHHKIKGELTLITSTLFFYHTDYLDSVLYDKFGAKISQKYGNGIKTDYTYDPITRRLSNITTLNGNSQLSAIAYTYDLVGNVTQVASTCPWLPNQSFI